MAQDSPAAVDDKLAGEIAGAAEEMARGAGEILLGHFGRSITVEYKDEAQRDPVTSVDKASEEFLSSEIAKRFPATASLARKGRTTRRRRRGPRTLSGRWTRWTARPTF